MWGGGKGKGSRSIVCLCSSLKFVYLSVVSLFVRLFVFDVLDGSWLASL